MGISGLLPLLSSISKTAQLSQFRGQTLGVDAYGWLHRGTFACAFDLALDKPTDRYVKFCMDRVEMLTHFGIKPYLVFDGDRLPSKAATEHDRATRRREAKRVGLELLRHGKASQAAYELQKAVDVTPTMARRLIEELKRAGVRYVVAPYEADSQMVYLEREGVIDGIISEDSDLLVFGARTLLTKLDAYAEVVVLRREDFAKCYEVDLIGWTDVQFRHMAILSGCDYLANIPGVGLKKAHRLLRRHKTVGQVVKVLQFDSKHKVPAGYMADIERADRTFLHQWVFCPEERRLVHLNPLPEKMTLDDLPFIGEYVEPEIACGVAAGDLDPHTKECIPVPAPIPVPVKGHAARQSAAARNKEIVAQTPEAQQTKPIESFFKPVKTPLDENTSAAKKTKPIESFFKPVRTPLAELDPNCFTPSPSQQQLLEQQQGNGPWSASPAPAVQPLSHLRRTSNGGGLPSPSQQSVGRTRSTPLSHHVPGSHNAKRMRLCADGESANAASGLSTSSERSRFFAPKEQAITRADETSLFSTRKKSKRSEFNIFSDDSVEDAFATLADPPDRTIDTAHPNGGSPKSIDKDPDVLPVSLPRTATLESQLTANTAVFTDDSQNSRQTLTQATSVGLDSQIFEPQDCVPDSAKKRSNADQAEPSTFAEAGADDVLTRAPSSPTRPCRSGTTRTPPKPKPVLPEHYSAIRFPETPPTAGSPGNAKVDEFTRRVTESNVLVFESPPIQPYLAQNSSGANSRVISAAEAATITTRALIQQGSEDMLIPCSSDDAASESDGEGKHLDGLPLSPIATTSTLDLSRFAFMG